MNGLIQIETEALADKQKEIPRLIDAGLSEDQAVNIVKLACAGKLGAMTINF